MMFGIGLCLLSIALYVQGECSGGCDEPILFYKDLDCKPIYASSGDCCPSHYDCSGIEERARSNAEQCYFRGKTYGSGEGINNDEIYGNCKVGCTCRKKASENMGFTCAILDCPEWLGQRPKPGCYLKYELNKCCNVGEVCEPYKVTCNVNGKTYHEGQRFDAPNLKCTKCVCQEGFQGKFEEPYCKQRACLEEVNRQKEVKNFCAPTFISKDDCCPFNWLCPEDSDKIVPAESATDLKCKFGSQSLNIGDSFSRTSGEKGKVSCECRVPPYLTCIQNYEYPSYAPEY